MEEPFRDHCGAAAAKRQVVPVSNHSHSHAAIYGDFGVRDEIILG
jgi:hypothetical protein